ncbi:DUF448 domain-containing protein [uncultured Pseudodesulfovibrio sp.]|uniref:YlxR family protein n=1 Tax=uncultured Pseudodesulfovibrio sp. TaxID=2035858 RepID=UPI0029C7FCE3|nr:DUF448 domain-containing protein [uncultured Pseudodesulfovibrio sp.]
MSDKGHSPERMCVVCRKRFPKAELTRYVSPEDLSGPDASPVPDPANCRPGRGYYVCAQARCGERFPKMILGLMKKRAR